MSAVYEPKVTAVQITPNPAGINATLTIRVSVTEAEVTMYRVSKISGAAISGEAVNPAIHKEVI